MTRALYRVQYKIRDNAECMYRVIDEIDKTKNRCNFTDLDSCWKYIKQLNSQKWWSRK